MNQYIFQCDDSIDGIFTAIYDAWSSGYGHKNIKIELNDQNTNLTLFTEYILVVTDLEKASKVAKTVKEKISSTAYESVCRAALSNQVDKANIIYHFVVMGIHYGSSIITNYSDSDVQSIFEMNRTIGNEVHHYTGFLRFSELNNKVLYAKVNPKGNIITLLAPHFADRLPNENWIIHDEIRQLACVHKASEGWIQVDSSEVDFSKLGGIKSEEQQMEQLWKAFVESITIRERTNLKLQRQNLPLRFRNNMTEWKK